METLEVVRNLEAELMAKRREVGRALRERRNALNLTLIQVGNRTRLSPSALHNIERNKSWNTKTVAKVARFYERASAA